MMTWFPHFVKKLSGKSWINDFVFGAVAAVVGPIIATVFKLYLSLETSWINLLFLLIALFLTLKNKVPLWLIIPGGGVIYLLLKASIEKLLI
jgi:chromate transport protein ChrA